MAQVGAAVAGAVAPLLEPELLELVVLRLDPEVVPELLPDPGLMPELEPLLVIPELLPVLRLLDVPDPDPDELPVLELASSPAASAIAATGSVFPAFGATSPAVPP